jgi:hypothetical protein
VQDRFTTLLDASSWSLYEVRRRRIVGADGVVRYILRERRIDAVDHLFVAAPAGPEPKQRPGFEQWWQEATGESLF